MVLSSYVTTGETLALEHKHTSTSLYPNVGIGILYMNVLTLLFGEGHSSQVIKLFYITGYRSIVLL